MVDSLKRETEALKERISKLGNELEAREKRAEAERTKLEARNGIRQNYLVHNIPTVLSFFTSKFVPSWC